MKNSCRYVRLHFHVREKEREEHLQHLIVWCILDTMQLFIGKRYEFYHYSVSKENVYM